MSDEVKKTSTKKYYDNVNVAKRTKQVVYIADEQDKPAMLALFMKNSNKTQTVILAKSKRRADELSAFLKTKEIISASIHGNHRAVQIKETTEAFNGGQVNILITTDMILQSLELSGIETIISYDLPSNHEEYFSRLILVDEVGESILFVAPEDNGVLNLIEIKSKNEIPQEELQGFVPTQEDALIHSLKEKTNKPRHQKQKTKPTVKKAVFR